MSDRVRLGELLAGIGAVGLTVLLLLADWLSFDAKVLGAGVQGTLPAIGAGARDLGWFAFLVTVLAAIAGVLYLVRVLTAHTTERVMLQAPVAFAAAKFAFVVDAVRLLIFTPGDTLSPGAGLPQVQVEGSVALGGWLGLAALLLLAVGAWISMEDERTQAAGSKAQTEALLADVEPRVIPADPSTGASA